MRANNLLCRYLAVLIVRLKHAFSARLNSVFKDLKTILLYRLKSLDCIVFRRIKQTEG